ncbi:HNH endonuclease signature motif containing protein [Desulfobacter sp.]
MCRQKIDDSTRWHKHHIIWRIHGGTDLDENLVLLHPNCHKQLHRRKLTVEKAESHKRL